MQNEVQMSFKTKLKVVFHICSYVILGLLSLFGSGLFLYFLLAKKGVGEAWIFYIYGSFALLSFLLYVVLLLLSFLPIHKSDSYFFGIDICYAILRISLLFSALMLLLYSYTFKEEVTPLLRTYSIFLLIFEGVFFVFGLLTMAWFKENPGRYRKGTALTKTSLEKPLKKKE